MEIQEFTRQLLFSGALEDKLFSPLPTPYDSSHSNIQKYFTDHQPIFSGKLPETPSREKNILFSNNKNSNNKEVKFPNLDALSSDSQRGILLHFFANHELLALEIMALALLRFPNAPKKFRYSLISTICDEQKHMKLYLNKMQELGVEFGSIPLNQFFWDSLSKMKTPLDFVANMSLTFEQANLDFSIYYQKIFTQLEDNDIANILKEVYLDEIRHVKSGVHWLKEWKPPEQSLWLAYSQQLEFPLTPQRAKGNTFDFDSRKQAGFDDDFILNLQTYSHSKGTAPKVFLFAPDGEEQILNKISDKGPKNKYSRPAIVQKLTEDLSTLPAFFASSCDIILTESPPSKEWKKNFLNTGFSLPEFSPIASIPKERKLLSLHPWSYSQNNSKTLQPLQKNVAFPYELTEKNQISLYSKQWSLKALKKFLLQLKTNNSNHHFCDTKEIGIFTSEVSELEDLIQSFFNKGFSRLVIKAPYGASGRNMFHIFQDRFSSKEKDRILKTAFNMISRQKGVIIEPWLEKVFDYSLQISIVKDSNEKVSSKIHGTARFLSNERGQYKGALLGGFTTNLDSETKKFLNDYGRNSDFLKNHLQELSDFICQESLPHNYIGPIGIDAFVYKDLNDNFKIKPIVETNFRYNMGLLVTKLEKKLSSPGEGLWYIFTKTEVKKSGCKSIKEFNEKLSEYFNPLTKGVKTKEQPQFLQASYSVHEEFTAYIFWAKKLSYIEDSLQSLNLPISFK